MFRPEIYSPEGLRQDGRRYNQLRRFECRVNTHPDTTDGSSYVEQGNTKIICHVRGPREPESSAKIGALSSGVGVGTAGQGQQQQSSSERATVIVEIDVAAFSSSTGDRASVKRTGSSRTGDKRLMELRIALQDTFNQAILTHLYARSAIDVRLFIVAQDGGLLQGCINAMTLAIIDGGIAMYDYVAACSGTVFGKVPLLDLNASEESQLPAVLTVATIGSTNSVALMLLESKMPAESLGPLIELVVDGTHCIRQLMDKEIRRHNKLRNQKSLLHSR